MAWEARSGLKPTICCIHADDLGLNGLGGPFGIETQSFCDTIDSIMG